MVFQKLPVLLLLIIGQCFSSEVCNDIYANVSSNEIYEENPQYQFSQYGKIFLFFIFFAVKYL